MIALDNPPRGDVQEQGSLPRCDAFGDRLSFAGDLSRQQRIDFRSAALSRRFSQLCPDEEDQRTHDQRCRHHDQWKAEEQLVRDQAGQQHECRQLKCQTQNVFHGQIQGQHLPERRAEQCTVCGRLTGRFIASTISNCWTVDCCWRYRDRSGQQQSRFYATFRAAEQHDQS